MSKEALAEEIQELAQLVDRFAVFTRAMSRNQPVSDRGGTGSLSDALDVDGQTLCALGSAEVVSYTWGDVFTLAEIARGAVKPATANGDGTATEIETGQVFPIAESVMELQPGNLCFLVRDSEGTWYATKAGSEEIAEEE